MTGESVSPTATHRLEGRVLSQERLSSSMWRLVIELEAPTSFLPGQFCMINLMGSARFPLSRPLSILAADGTRLELLYKAVGRGTKALAAVSAGAPVRVLTPLGTTFPPRADDRPRLLLAGGVGLPPLWAWRSTHGRDEDVSCFGGRDHEDVPWSLLGAPWRVSVDSPGKADDGRDAFTGTVVALAEHLLGDDAPEHVVLSCGPLPLLRAARELALRRGWSCLVSVEERMGCGYGVCRGCVVPAAVEGWRTACLEGPVFDAEELDWDRLGVPADRALTTYEATSPPACGAPEVTP